MKLHVFNPSHDEALSANYPYYYPSNTARRCEEEWASLPALWAAEGDCVLIPNTRPLPEPQPWCSSARFVHPRKLNADFWQQVSGIEPWGWDLLLRHRLRKMGVPEHLLPTDEDIATIRKLSSRATTTLFLPPLVRDLRNEGLHVADARSELVSNLEDVKACVNSWGGAMVKSLWSCSGRGVRTMPRCYSRNDELRAIKLLREQGSAELEPIYHPVFNFALEFEALPSAEVCFCGFSCFQSASSGAYGGNAVAEQSLIRRLITEAGNISESDLQTLVSICSRNLASFIKGQYAGALGIDMMFVEESNHAGKAVTLHPCVEVNMRRTMGHTALAIAQRKLKNEELPLFIQDLCYFCIQ